MGSIMHHFKKLPLVILSTPLIVASPAPHN
jgi:hypothetical protein